MNRVVRLFVLLFVLVAMMSLGGCAAFRSYKEPDTGARARVRLVGNQPAMSSYQCGSEEGNQRGFAYYGNKRHDLHMPNPPEKVFAITEYYVEADKHLTVTFADPGLIAPKGYQVRYSGPACNYTSVTFIPKPGHDYEVREHGTSFCTAAVAELVPSASASVTYVPVVVAPPCPKNQDQ